MEKYVYVYVFLISYIILYVYSMYTCIHVFNIDIHIYFSYETNCCSTWRFATGIISYKKEYLTCFQFLTPAHGYLGRNAV